MARALAVEIVGDASKFARELDKASSKTSRFGAVAKVAGVAAAAGLAAGMGYAVAKAVEFDREMRNVNSIAKLSQSQFEDLSKSVRGMAGETGQAPKTLAQGLYDIVSSGFKAAQGIKILRTSAKAATAGLTDTATATKAVVGSLNAYHLGANRAAQVGDILFQTVNKGVLTFEELSQQIGDVIPSASTLGVPLQQVGGALATITLHSVPAAEAATQVKQVMISMLKPSVALAKQFHQMGFESGQAAIKQLGFVGVVKALSKAAGDNKTKIATWFPNIRALGGFFGLAGKNLKTFTDNVDSMGVKGALVSAFNEQSKSVAVQWQKARAEFDNVSISLGQKLLPAITKALGGVMAFITFLEAHPNVAKALAIGLGFVAAGFIAVAVAATAADIAASPFIAAVLGITIAIAALVTGLVLAYQHFATFRAIVDAVFGFMRDHWQAIIIGFLAVFAALPVALVLAWQKSETFRNVVTGVFNTIRNILTDWIHVVLTIIDKWLGGLQLMAQAASHLPFIGDKFKGVADAIGGARDKVIALRDGIDNLHSKTIHVNVVLDIAGEAVRQAAKTIGDALNDAAKQTKKKRRALGGPVDALTPYIVGERGPELFVPGASGGIIPNSRLGGSQFVFNFPNFVGDKTELVKTVRTEFTRYTARNARPA